MIIDLHAHLGSWHDFLLPEPSTEWLLRTNERVGIGISCVSHLSAIAFDARHGNALALAAAEGNPGRLAVWLTVNPHFDDIGFIREHLAHPMVWGLKLHPEVHQYPVTGPRYEPYLRLVEEAGLAVLSHGETRTPWSTPADVAEVARRHTNTFLLGHAGLLADSIDQVAVLAATVPNLYAELSGSQLTHPFIERLVEGGGEEKVVFGSDACFLDQRWGVGRIHYSNLSGEAKAKIFSGNAERILDTMGRKLQ